MQKNHESGRSSRYRPSSDAQRRAVAKYNAKFVTLTVRLAPEKRDALNAWAAERGESVVGILNRYIDRILETGEA